MDFHAITSAGAELLMRVVDDQVIIVLPPADLPAAAPAPPEPGK
jgi:hypothetical protein